MNWHGLIVESLILLILSILLNVLLVVLLVFVRIIRVDVFFVTEELRHLLLDRNFRRTQLGQKTLHDGPDFGDESGVRKIVCLTLERVLDVLRAGSSLSEDGTVELLDFLLV